jgi:hypothetical protein
VNRFTHGLVWPGHPPDGRISELTERWPGTFPTAVGGALAALRFPAGAGLLAAGEFRDQRATYLCHRQPGETPSAETGWPLLVCRKMVAWH